jgi:hypothetical protein
MKDIFWLSVSEVSVHSHLVSLFLYNSIMAVGDVESKVYHLLTDCRQKETRRRVQGQDTPSKGRSPVIHFLQLGPPSSSFNMKSSVDESIDTAPS